MTPPYIPRNVVSLIGKLIDAKEDYRKRWESTLPYHNSLQEAEANVRKIENQLEEALEEILAKR